MGKRIVGQRKSGYDIQPNTIISTERKKAATSRKFAQWNAALKAENNGMGQLDLFPAVVFWILPCFYR